MNTLLWSAQGLLAIVFSATGLMKLVRPKQKLIENLHVLAPIPAPLIKGIGLAEILGAIGVTLPQMLGIEPGLVVVAALGLALVMVGAAIAQARDRSWMIVGLNVLLLAAALFVALGRWS